MFKTFVCKQTKILKLPQTLLKNRKIEEDAFHYENTS